MKVIKRNGNEVLFDFDKIRIAVNKANKSVQDAEKLTEAQIELICDNTERRCTQFERAVAVEEIQDIVEDEIMSLRAFKLARNYITYRYTRALARKSNSTDEQILSLIECANEEIKQENSNKNPTIVSVQRDYMAGEVSKDISKRILLPAEVVKAHDEGIIHFHDMDYYSQHMFNCCLINLKDMLQHGTVISQTMIEKPKSFATACNITTQIIAQVASSQYGGQTISLAHLAPFVDVSRKKIIKEVNNELMDTDVSESKKNEIVKKRVLLEIKRGIQMIQYQVITLMTTNGQAPFITINMYLNEAENEQEKADLALCIEEMLRQRMLGIKNEKGIYITPAFPKLIYVLQDDNITRDSKYYYLTELAAKCTAKRMVPDYVSEKIMKQLKIDKNGEGHCYPPMGCVDGSSVIDYMINDNIHYVESFERAWNRLSMFYPVKKQPNGKDSYMDTPNVTIWDEKKKKYVKQYRMIRNSQSEWFTMEFTGGRSIDVTSDHPFEVEEKGVVFAKDMKIGDSIIKKVSNIKESQKANFNKQMWFNGLVLCDGCYESQLNISLGLDELDIVNVATSAIKDQGFEPYLVEQNRGVKGHYYDLKTKKSSKLCNIFATKFGGINKLNRQIPSEIFNSDRNIKLSFLAGMIDANGYIDNVNNTIRIQIGSTNEELARQQMELAISLGFNAVIYKNYYKSNSSKIRFRVEFNCNNEMVEYLVSEKKKQCFNLTYKSYNSTLINSSICSLKTKTSYTKEKYSYDVTTESEHFTVNGLYSHNCRSFLTPYVDENNQAKFYGRFNQGVVTISLPDVALSSEKDYDKFWKIFDERLELCHKALLCRHERLEETLSDASPIHWQFGAMARLKKGEKIDKLLHGGYSTISLGYAGLYECVKYMTGKSHTDQDAEEFALKVMQHMNDKCAEWKAEHPIDFSLYGTPLESTTYKFSKTLQNRFGLIKGITDRNYITNSYHVPVFEKINAFDKLKFESKFQALSPGGAISYVEVPNMQNNIEAVISVIQFIYDNIMYAELNTKSDYCSCCGFDGEIQIVDDGEGKLVWECPKCGNRDQTKMSVARRTCGYIGTQYWNQGRTQEIKERVLHL